MGRGCCDGEEFSAEANPIATACDPKHTGGPLCGQDANLFLQTAGGYQLAKETGKGAKKGGGRQAQNKKQLEWEHKWASRGPLKVSNKGMKQGRHRYLNAESGNIKIAALNVNVIRKPQKVSSVGQVFR